MQPYCRAIQYVKYTVGAIVDFDLPEELKLLKDTVRKFVDRELIPLERECRPEGEDMPEQYIKPLQEKDRKSVV